MALSFTAPHTGLCDKARFTACLIALALSIAAYWLLNWCAFPLFDDVWRWTREASAIASGITLTAVALLSYWRPHWFQSRFMMGAIGATALAGAASCGAGILLSQSAILIVGASAATVAAGLSNIVVGISCIGLSMRQLGLCATGAYGLAYASRGMFALLPGSINFALFCIAPVAAAVLVARFARPVLNQQYAHGTPAEVALTAPASVLPFGHQFFLALLLFRFIYGFTLTFGETDRTPVLAVGALLPFAVVLAIAAARRKALSPESLFQLSILFSVAGFLIVSIGEDGHRAASVLLSCGTGFFEMFMYYMLIALGTKNPVVALPMLAWGNAMASWGTLLGANFGRLANSFANRPALLAATVALVIFCIVAYILLARKELDFTATLRGITPVSPLVTVQGTDGSALSLEERCRDMSEACGLTAREAEVFGYLARGRNVRFIEEELVVSYNTVKTHVSHIYAKLGVHSHQELIDLVEQGDASRT